MRILRPSLLSLVAVLATTFVVYADSGPSAGTPIEKAVDHFIDAALREAGITPIGRADDAALIRRLTLDLVGRIPTVAETQAFVASTDPTKVEQLVDRLMASSGYARHQANEFNVLLMGSTRGSIREYLRTAFAENRSWDRIFRELMLPDQNDPKQKSAAEFLRIRIDDLDKVTAEVSALFFGVDISCARCHDHPRVEDWKQDHFFGLKAFLARTFDNGGLLAERDHGQVKFKTVKSQEKVAGFLFLTGTKLEGGVIEEPSKDGQAKEKEYFERFKKEKKPAPLPKNSARAQLVEVALKPGQRDLIARSIVNRLWARLHGIGLVEPLDQMHAGNLSNHPDLLTWLANDLIAHGYDLRRLTRGLVLSQTYARSSRWEQGDAPRPNQFAMAQLRPLGPMQMSASLRLATTDPAAFGKDVKPADVEKKIEGIENGAGGFASLLDQPGQDFQISVAEALLFSNSERIEREFLTDGGDRLVGRLKKIDDPKELVETAVWAVLSRAPRAEETQAMMAYLTKRSDRKVDACKQIVWALITSAEFRFNY